MIYTYPDKIQQQKWNNFSNQTQNPPIDPKSKNLFSKNFLLLPFQYTKTPPPYTIFKNKTLINTHLQQKWPQKTQAADNQLSEKVEKGKDDDTAHPQVPKIHT